MGRYTGPTDRLSRREGVNLFLKGERSYTGKLDRRLEQPPGVHGLRRSKFSEYGIRLREKQKVKNMYGIREKQFSRYFKRAARMSGITGSLLITMLEQRLDNWKGGGREQPDSADAITSLQKIHHCELQMFSSSWQGLRRTVPEDKSNSSFPYPC